MFDILLCLSGGKDSCSLAFTLSKDKNLKMLTFTADIGFMSQVAWNNIMKTVNILNLNHIVWKPERDVYEQNITRFFSNPKEGLNDVCSNCSLLTQSSAYFFATKFGINKIVMGFSKYNEGGAKRYKKGNVEFINPYRSNYELPEIRNRLSKYGIETSPLKTNCTMIEHITRTHIKRFNEHPYEKEIDKMLEDKVISREEAHRYKNFGVPEHIPLSNDKLDLKPFSGKEDDNYLINLVLKYKYNKSSKERIRYVINKYGHLFWVLMKEGKRLGVVYTSYYPGLGYTIDGYRDGKAIRKLDSKVSYPFQALKLVTDYMLNNVTDKLWTTHDVKNRAATILCKKYNYKINKKEKTPLGDFVFLVKEKGGK